MARNSNRKGPQIIKKPKNIDLNLIEDNSKDESNSDISIQKYQDDKDFDEAFKNLLRPIESITKNNQCEPLQYNLLKELDSYLVHLKESESGSGVFVEAALMIQNVIFIYQKRVDQLVDVMMKLIGKFRAFRINQVEDDLGNGGECNQKKKKEKKIKFYSSFEPINGQVAGTLKNFDCKTVNLSKKQPVPKIVLNANIKIDQKYSEILPYIYVGNGEENIGKKYDFLLSCPINRDLAVNEEFDCSFIKSNDANLFYRKSIDPLPSNLMEVDEVDSEEILPSTPDPILFDQTVNEPSICVPNAIDNAIAANLMNASQVSEAGDPWDDLLIKVQKDNFTDKPLKPQNSKKLSTNEDNKPFWLPTFTFSELNINLIQVKSNIPVDPAFRLKLHEIINAQKSEVAKIKRRKVIEKEKERFNFYDEEMDEKLRNGEEPGFKGFDSPENNDNFDDGIFDDNAVENVDEPLVDNLENFQEYQKNALEMEKLHADNKLQTMDEQLEMRKRVQAWHDNLRPILEEEERNTAFDIHAYGTRLLNSFSAIGEKKTFKELAGGLEQGETARYFLATLMMVNTYNLKMTKTKDGSHNNIIIELLKKERHHEELQKNIGNQVNQEPN